jgi:hypothetical protein
MTEDTQPVTAPWGEFSIRSEEREREHERAIVDVPAALLIKKLETPMTRRTYLTMKEMQANDKIRTLTVVNRVTALMAKHPEWSVFEMRTWDEWEYDA